MYERYCRLRDSKKLKDADVAKMTGITPSTFSDWKKGKSAPNVVKMVSIARVLNTTVEYFVTGIETDWFETGLSLLGWEEKEEERDNSKYETTLTNGEESVRVSADDIEHMTNALKMHLLNMLTGSKRVNDASLGLSDDESLLLQGFHAMGEESQRYLLMMARDALGAKSSGSAMSSISRADVVSA